MVVGGMVQVTRNSPSTGVNLSNNINFMHLETVVDLEHKLHIGILVMGIWVLLQSHPGSNGNGSVFEYDVPTGYYALNTKNLKDQS